MAQAASGTTTFLFTDLEGSTRLLRELKGSYAEVLDTQQRLARGVFEANDGEEVDTQGDSFFVAFRRARDAIAAAVELQLAVAAEPWPAGADVRVRVGVHTGDPITASGRYLGLGVHQASRICAAAHGGQVLLSNVTRGLVEDDLPAGVRLRDLGPQRLKDFERPEHLFQLEIDGLPSDFPPPRGTVPPFRRLTLRPLVRIRRKPRGG